MKTFRATLATLPLAPKRAHGFRTTFPGDGGHRSWGSGTAADAQIDASPSAYPLRTRELAMRKVLAISAAVLAIVTGASLAPVLFAKVILNTIDPVLAMSADGRHITVTGPISCSQTQPLDLSVTVTQRTTGAIAQGHTRIACTAEQRQWAVQAWVRGNETFEEGAATAVAVALTTTGHTVDDAHQWLVNVTLTGE